ncbi:O-antigen polymerase [Vibrio astriarenae]
MELKLGRGRGGLFAFLSAFLFVLSEISNDVIVSITSIWLVFFLCLCLFNQKRNFFDPRLFVSAFFALYHTWFPLSFVIGKENRLFPIYEHILIESINYSLFGIIVYVNVVSFLIWVFSHYGYNDKNEPQTISNTHTSKSEYIILISTISVAILSMFFFSSGDFASKSDINSSGGAIKTFSYFSMLLANVVILLRACRLTYNQIIFDKVIISFLLVSLLYVGFTGERDTLFRNLICLLIIFYSKKENFGSLKIILFIFAVSLVVPVSQAFKAVLLSGFNGLVLELNTIFSNEFVSASRNLYSLLHFKADFDISFIFRDIARAFVPSAFLSGSDIYSAGQWFNSEFRVVNHFSGRAGWGFGIIAEGYLLGGYFGVFIVMTIVAALISTLYVKTQKSEYHFVWYILSLTVILYVMRADVANLLSQVFKINGVAILIIIGFSSFMSFLSKKAIHNVK